MRIFYLSLVLIIFDQITKILAKGFTFKPLNIVFDGLSKSPPVEVYGKYFRLTYVENEGMAFGWLPFAEKSTLYLSLFTIVACLGLIIYLYKIRKDSLLLRLPLAVILAGAFGNLIDRVFYGVIFNGGKLFGGAVVDFIDIDFIDLHAIGMTRWPVFNLADMYVSLGVITLFITSYIYERKKKKAELAIEYLRTQSLLYNISPAVNEEETVVALSSNDIEESGVRSARFSEDSDNEMLKDIQDKCTEDEYNNGEAPKI